MTSKQVTDRGGKTLDVDELEGRLYPRFDNGALESSFTFKARPDDIVLCTYPKSGTHWTFEVIRLLQAGTTDPPLQEKEDTMIEAVKETILEKVPSPRNLNTHYHFEKMSPEFFTQKCKIVYMARNPRDVAGSYFNHHRKFTSFYNYYGEWKDYFHLFLEGQVDYDSWFEYTKGWEKGMKDNPDHPFLVMSYEDMKENPLREVKRLAEFLGLERSDDFLQEVVKKTSFDAMKSIRVDIDPDVHVIFNKGIAGDWINRFTVAQSEIFNQVFEKEMVGTDAYKLYSHTVQGKKDANKDDA